MISDSDFGLGSYQTVTIGVGGQLKRQPEDFMVQEVSESGLVIPFPPDHMSYPHEAGGLFLHGRVMKKEINHSRLLRQLAEIFEVRPSDVETAGIKDTHAITVQEFSVYKPKTVPLDPTALADGFIIDSLQYQPDKHWTGKLKGNFFTITIRDCLLDESVMKQFAENLSSPLINYYGYQRFGGTRPITAKFGRLLLAGQDEAAINCYLGDQGLKFDAFRQQWNETHDADIVLANHSNIPKIEHNILQTLKFTDSYTKALQSVPTFLVSLAKDAFISLLTNEYLALRREDTSDIKGERRTGNNIEVALPSKHWPKPLNARWEEVFERHDVSLAELQSINHTTRLRWLNLSNFSYQLTSDAVQVSFMLTKGQYATVLLRELMKQGPEFMS